MVFFTLYFQLLGFSDLSASVLMAVFTLGCAVGALIGGALGELGLRSRMMAPDCALTQHILSTELRAHYRRSRGTAQPDQRARVCRPGERLCGVAPLMGALPGAAANDERCTAVSGCHDSLRFRFDEHGADYHMVGAPCSVLRAPCDCDARIDHSRCWRTRHKFVEP